MSKRPILLYVDDEPINLMLFEAQFDQTFNVITAKSGNDGLVKLRSNPAIRFVISDMKMPGMNGVEFISIAKKDFPDIIYTVLTAFDVNSEIAEALSNGLIFKYFRKPYCVNEIEQALR